MIEEQELANKLYSYLLYAVCILIFAASILLSNAYLLLLTSVFLLASVIYLNSGHLINNLLIKRSNVIEIYNGYRLSNTLDSAVKRVGSEFHSFSAAFLIIEKPLSPSSESMKSLIEGIHEPFEFTIAIREAEKKKITETLETRRRMKEIALARSASASYDKINNLKRDIAILEADIENIKKGGKPLGIILKISSTATSKNEAEAAISSSSRIKYIAEAFSAVLNMEHEILKGEALLGFLEA